MLSRCCCYCCVRCHNDKLWCDKESQVTFPFRQFDNNEVRHCLRGPHRAHPSKSIKRDAQRMLAASQQQKSGIKKYTISSFDFPWWQQQQRQTTILNYILALPCFKTRKCCCCGFCHSQKNNKNYTTLNDSSKTIISLALSAVVCGVSFHFFGWTALSFLWKFLLSSERHKNINEFFLSERKNC